MENYIKNIEKQNEELQKKLAEAENECNTNDKFISLIQVIIEATLYNILVHKTIPPVTDIDSIIDEIVRNLSPTKLTEKQKTKLKDIMKCINEVSLSKEELKSHKLVPPPIPPFKAIKKLKVKNVLRKRTRKAK